ncbi:hypothetical protein LTR70_005450 [Exophiala xenobiotica]|uniref:histidine kinase n=1 Tax=Lithohypha guttulata TaxID=1690604 RepID=A0ABR0KA54_9EURO|nr:hypothetical protein LTR24_005192 [Lithohypha guttulata]KAK5318427.1 hypothetical protein LTR70_005450 [Exophiala xenobiotica]
MGNISPAVKENLRSTVFDFQPVPIVVLSEKGSKIVLINRAAHQLFQSSKLLVDKDVSNLPIRWQDGSDDALQELLTQSSESGQISPDQGRDENGATLRLQVEITKNELHSNVTARLLVSKFNVTGESFRMLTFESIKEEPVVHAPSNNPEPTSLSPTQSTRPSLRAQTTSYSGAVDSTATSQTYLEARFSQLCDAIYHSEDRAGFLLAADNSFCYPNFRGKRDVAPVEIDDLEMFFNNWDIWDSTFTRSLTLSELPSIWLNRERKKFRNRRLGLKDGGKDIVLETSGDPLYDSVTGEYIGGVVWITLLGEYADVVASDLQSSLTDFRTICDRLPHLLWSVNDKCEADYFSKSWYDFTGLTEEQSMGTRYTEAIDNDDMRCIWDKFAKASENKTDLTAEAKYRRKDGQWVWMSVRAKAMRDNNGQVLKWYGTSTDVQNFVVERMEAETKQDQMMEMLSQNDIGLFEVKDGYLNVLEGRMFWLKDHRTSRLVKDLDDRKGPGIPEFKDHVWKILDGKEDSATFECQIRSRWYKFSLLQDGVDEPGGPEKAAKVFGCSVDVTEQHQRAGLQAENARLLHEASLEMEKSRLKTAFLAHMSHEIRTPIAGIIGTADMLAESRLDNEQQDCVNNIQVSANNLLTIVNDILDLSKIEAGKIQFEKTVFDVHALVRQVKELFKHTARSKSLELRTLRIDERASLEMVGDAGRVKQILTNLVSNAIKFTSQGSIDISVTSEGAKIHIAVQDSGEGIDDETMATLFKPFVQGDGTTARRHGGTGLGLTISRNLAQKMGGALILESKPSKGTKALLTLPREMGFSGLRVKPSDRPQIQQSVSGSVAIRDATAAATRGEGPPEPRTPSPSREAPTPSPPREYKPDSPQPEQAQKPKQAQQPTQGKQSNSSDAQPLVLVVEDNAINQKVALNLVRKLGYKTHAVWNGQEALDYLSSCPATASPASSPPPSSPPPAAILMDCQMPLLDGYEATKRLRTDQKFKNISAVPVIALTASAIQGDREKCQASGMDDYLSKPVNKALLKGMLERWIPQTPKG